MSPRRLLFSGAVLTALGLAIATTAPVLGTPGADHTRTQQGLGGVIVLIGWAALAWGIHRFGRSADG